MARYAVGIAPSGKAFGVDGVFAKTLKLDEELSAKALCALWGNCGQLGFTPTQWRRALLVPIYKKGDMRKPANYRPTSLLSQQRIIVEKAIGRRMQSEY